MSKPSDATLRRIAEGVSSKVTSTPDWSNCRTPSARNCTASSVLPLHVVDHLHLVAARELVLAEPVQVGDGLPRPRRLARHVDAKRVARDLGHQPRHPFLRSSPGTEGNAGTR